MDPGSMNSSTTDSSTHHTGYQWKKFTSVAPAKLKHAPPVKEPVSLHQQGYDNGYAEGYATGLLEGQDQAEEQTKAVLSELRHMLQEVKQMRDRTIADGLQDVAVALHSLFQQVFLHELKTSPSLIQSLANELRQTLEVESIPTIHVSQSVYNALGTVDASELEDYLAIDDGLPDGVLRASSGKAMVELDVVANLEQVLARACAADTTDEISGGDVEY